jgi:serine phosphatase RsbU (regulator of sigma subunit)/energy-coupling factor transporter transmembrane protein EcfT
LLSPGRLPPPSRAALVRYWLTQTFSGRAILLGAFVKVVAFVLTLALGTAPWLELIDTCGDLAMIVGALIIVVLLFADMKQRLLWRIRRKLAVSYIFIGFIPALLIIVFFLVAGLLLFFNIGSFMLRNELGRFVERSRLAAESIALDLGRSRTADYIRDSIDIRRNVLKRYAGTSGALVPSDGRCAAGGVSAAAAVQEVTVGPWAHLPAPTSIPSWVPCSGYSGLIAYSEGETTRLVSRAIVWPTSGQGAIVLDVPVEAGFHRELLDRTGLTILRVGLYDEASFLDADSVEREDGPRAIILGPANIGIGDDNGTLNWSALVNTFGWENGKTVKVVAGFGMSLADIYERIALTEESRTSNYDFGRAILWALALIGGLFLIIQAVAFAMGLALGRSITGSVHELFAGTERVRRGDFTGRVLVKSRDQLGELAQSFNSMTSSIENLLQEKAEKERLEQELRIARNIQMSLLPQGPLAMPGVTLTAHCEPAREVGGDYYDFLPIDEHTLGVLVADVSGKGTSAALYMAELKGIVLSLSQRHRSPRDLLIEADRIISRHLDSRSFITVTYLVVDLQAATLKYSRAGHCPLVYVPGPYAERRTPQLMAPDGLVLGLQLDEGRTFVRLLEEVTVPLGRGDLFVLYTDGLTEAMNAEGECFGDQRLATLIGQHADLPADELRERILREIDAFTGSALQQDDMTMVVLRVEQVGQGLLSPALASHVDA